MATDLPGFAYACGYTVHWFHRFADAAASRRNNWARMIAGELPENCVGQLGPCTAAEAAAWAEPHSPSGDWRPSSAIPSIDDDDIDGHLIAAYGLQTPLDGPDDDYNAIADQSLSPADRNPSLCR